MIKYKTQMVAQQVAETIVCNKCGQERPEEWPQHKDRAPFCHVSHRAGYGSPYDQDRFLFDLCEPCLIAFMLTLVVPVSIVCRDIPENEDGTEAAMPSLEEYLKAHSQ